MSTQGEPVTVYLPASIYRQLQQTAQTTRRRLEEVLLQTITGNLPPTVDEAPSDVQAELRVLPGLDTTALWAIARGRVSSKQQTRHEYLLRQNQRGTIIPAEREELRQLGDMADKLTLKKAYAYALLRWRGFPLPTLEAMESQL